MTPQQRQDAKLKRRAARAAKDPKRPSLPAPVRVSPGDDVWNTYLKLNSEEERASHTPEQAVEMLAQALWQHPSTHEKGGKTAILYSFEELRQRLRPGEDMSPREIQWVRWMSGQDKLPKEEYAKFTPPEKIRQVYPNYFEDAASVYSWIEEQGFEGPDGKRLWNAVLAMKFGKQSSPWVSFFPLKAGGRIKVQAEVVDDHVGLKVLARGV